MSNIDLANAKVIYEGKELPAIHLISILQTQLNEAACRIAGIAATLSDLQAALLNSNTVEVKLTLSKEDFGRFKSLEGADDGERIRKAVLAVIHPEKTEVTSRPAAPIEKALTTKCPRCQSLIELPEVPDNQWSVEVICGVCDAKYLVKAK